MANASSPSEIQDPPDDDGDFDVRTNRVERFVLAGAIIGPALIALLTWLERVGPINPGHFGSILAFVFSHVELIVLQGLTIWVAWRDPVLGGKVIRSVFITLMVVFCFGALKYAQYYSLWDDQISRFVLFMLLQHYASFLMGVAVMVLARRLFDIVLVKPGEPRNDRRRLSIRELMIWTLVMAGCLAFYHYMIGWAQNFGASSVAVPGWFIGYSIVMQYIPTTLLLVTMIYVQRFAFWKWFPILTLLYMLVYFADAMFQQAVYSAYFNVNATGFDKLQMIQPVFVVLATLFVVWMIRKCGYQFQHGPQIATTPVS